MKERALFLVRSYITTLAVFLIAKVVFMFSMRGSQPFGTSDVCDVLRHGFTLDLSTAFYFIVLPLLITIGSLWMSGRTTRRLFRIYFLVVAVAFSLAFIADTALYPHWGYKLDSTCLQYLASPKVAAASVLQDFLPSSHFRHSFSFSSQRACHVLPRRNIAGHIAYLQS